MAEEPLYLDNAASSCPKPPQVYAAVEAAMRLGANPGRSGHHASLEAARLIHDAREGVAALLNVADSSRVVFTFNASHALNAAFYGFLKPGDHVVTSSMEHNSVLRPLHDLSTSRGIEVSYLQADGEGLIDPAAVAAAITPKTTLVALTHGSNVCGSLVDAEAVGEICRSLGVKFLLDASQTVGALPVDVESFKVDMLAAPGHKGLLGPQGTGILYVREGIELTPFILGGTGFSSESLEMPSMMPERLEGGTLNTPGIAGLGAGVEYLAAFGVEKVRAKELEIIEYLTLEFAKRPEIITYGPTDPQKRVAVFSFNLRGRDGAHVGYVLDEVFNIAVRVGLHCAPQAHRTLGSYPEGTVRASFGPFNTVEDGARLVGALDRILKL